MEMLVRLFLIVASMMIIFLPSWGFAEDESGSCSAEDIFHACDINKDGKISKEEWDALDIDKDQIITNDEWDRYRFKSTEKPSSRFQIKYFDVHGDGSMGKEEFIENYKRLQ